MYVAVLTIKTVFKVAAGGIVIASAFELLRRGSTYDQLVNAITTCVLPAGAKLVQITEGSVNLKVQAEHISALDTLWSLYKDGTLKERLEDWWTGAGGKKTVIYSKHTHHDWPVKKVIVDLSIKMKRNSKHALVICRVHWRRRTRILAVLQHY